MITKSVVGETNNNSKKKREKSNFKHWASHYAQSSNNE